MKISQKRKVLTGKRKRKDINNIIYLYSHRDLIIRKEVKRCFIKTPIGDIKC